jgi:phosphoribosylformylglycinamidine (FGAM) synthase-like amidotransferase family enzyme
MKLIKKPQPEIVNLSEKYKVGQRIKVTTAHHDGRGHYDNCETLYTIEKVNRVTLDITNDDGYTYRFDPIRDNGGRDYCTGKVEIVQNKQLNEL